MLVAAVQVARDPVGTRARAFVVRARPPSLPMTAIWLPWPSYSG